MIALVKFVSVGGARVAACVEQVGRIDVDEYLFWRDRLAQVVRHEIWQNGEGVAVVDGVTGGQYWEPMTNNGRIQLDAVVTCAGVEFMPEDATRPKKRFNVDGVRWKGVDQAANGYLAALSAEVLFESWYVETRGAGFVHGCKYRKRRTGCDEDSSKLVHRSNQCVGSCRGDHRTQYLRLAPWPATQ